MEKHNGEGQLNAGSSRQFHTYKSHSKEEVFLNCLIIDDDELSSGILKQYIQQSDFLHLIKVCHDPLDALALLRQEQIDLLFLDIEMPKMNGMELLESLEVRPQIILTTSHAEYAIRAFDFNVVDYLLKPVEFPRFLKATLKAKTWYDSQTHPVEPGKQDYLYIRKNSVLNKIHLNDILWIEALGDYVSIQTAEQKFTIHLTLKALDTKLPREKFTRVHRSYIVNLDHIKTIDDFILSVHGKSIPVGLIYRENFMKRLNLLL
jgi:DNA-binding LytR/AlgR family response regulator